MPPSILNSILFNFTLYIISCVLLLQAARDETLPFGASLLPAKRKATIAYQPCMTTLVGALQPALRSSALLSDDPLIRRVLSINWAGDREDWRIGAIGSRRVSPEIRRDEPRSAELHRDEARYIEVSRDHPRLAEIGARRYYRGVQRELLKFAKRAYDAGAAGALHSPSYLVYILLHTILPSPHRLTSFTYS